MKRLRVAPAAVGDDVGVVGGRVAGRRQGADDGVAELHDLVVGERDVGELHAGARGQVGGRPGRLDEPGQARDMIGLQVRLEYRDDRQPIRSASDR